MEVYVIHYKIHTAVWSIFLENILVHVMRVRLSFLALAAGEQFLRGYTG
jgi:hypothetical protein